jgi:hypothetical protein
MKLRGGPLLTNAGVMSDRQEQPAGSLPRRLTEAGVALTETVVQYTAILYLLKWLFGVSFADAAEASDLGCEPVSVSTTVP